MNKVLTKETLIEEFESLISQNRRLIALVAHMVELNEALEDVIEQHECYEREDEEMRAYETKRT